MFEEYSLKESLRTYLKLSNEEELIPAVYADAYSRMRTHLKHNSKNKLTSVHLITSKIFNKSATLDIESNLIKYMSADNVYKLLNGNIGLANHNYYNKVVIFLLRILYF